MKLCDKSPALRVAANRCKPCEKKYFGNENHDFVMLGNWEQKKLVTEQMMMVNQTIRQDYQFTGKYNLLK